MTGATEPAAPVKIQGWTGRITGAIAALAVGVANLGAVLGNVDEIRQFLWARLGLLGLENLVVISGVLVLGALILYLLLSAVIHLVFLRGRPRMAIGYWTFIALTAPLIGYITFNEFGPSRMPAMIEAQITRLEQTTRSQFTLLTETEGAFRFSLAQTSETPQAWTSAQALAAILSTDADLSSQDARMVRASLNYLEQVRTADGWGYQDGDPIGVTEIAAWVILSEAMSLDPRFSGQIWGGDISAGVSRVHEHLAALAARQHVDGGWGPIARTDDPRHARTYSTIMALMALLEAGRQPAIADDPRWAYDSVIARGVRWLLLRTQNSTNEALGWYPNPSLPRQVGECLGLTAQAIYVLQSAQGRLGVSTADPALAEVRRAFLEQALQGVAGLRGASSAASRDFHFNCRVHDTDIYLPGVSGFRLEPSTYLWYPWSLAAVSLMADDPSLSSSDRNMTGTLRLLLGHRIEDATDSAHNDQALYVVAETLYAANVSVRAHD